MGAKALAARGRRAAERDMVDTCTIVRVTGVPGPIDPDTGQRPPAPTATVYGPGILPANGKCKVQTYEAHESTPDSGEHVFTVQRYYVHLPVAADVAKDDQITIAATVLDPNLAGRTYRVVGLLHKTFATANRVIVDEIVR